jgi:2-keto-3-deoxy-L-rhamnonate aldolase RhmA
MTARLMSGLLAAVLGALPSLVEAQEGGRMNPVIGLLEEGRPVFGLYAPSPRPRGPAGSPPAAARTPEQLAAETVAYRLSDFVFDGSMEGGVEEGLPAFSAFAEAMRTAKADARTHPLVVKMSEIHLDPEAAAGRIASQLNAGASGVMLVDVRSAEEVRLGLRAMRFRSRGGLRPDHVGSAPGYWGLSEEEYRSRADLWPLNPDGELINWTIIESLEGLRKVREIAAVEGIGVLWPGAGTLRGLFTSTGPDGQRVFDAEGWEAAIQSVLAACLEFDVPCGFPASADDIELRMQQGFRVFVMGWGDAGFRTVDKGRGIAGR